MMSANCSYPGCQRPAECLKMCMPHYARWRRGGDMDRPIRGQRPHELARRLSEAALRYAHAETEDEYQRAWGVLRDTAKLYASGAES